jgi:site-specific recombinase XerD
MFEQLFLQPRALARYHVGPLLEERQRFLAHLADSGLSRRTLRTIAAALLRVAGTLDLVHRPDEYISRDEITRKSTDKWYKFISVATRWLRFLGRLKQEPVPANPYADKIEAFVDYMRNERGFSPLTVQARSWALRRLLAQCGTPTGSLREISITRIDDSLVRMVNQDGYSRLTVRNWAHDLRAFLHFAETRGWCRKGLAAGIKSPRTFSQVSLPVGPSWDDVRHLLAMTEGNRPVDIRDRAILFLLAIYGLRRGEVNGLRLSDFDWEGELLSVECSKTRRTRTYPLIRIVGDAVLRYLKEVRPRSAYREVFLTMHHPIHPLRTAVSTLVGTRLRRLGVSLSHYGSHVLRHACATHLLAHGLSLKEIGDHLGHQNPDTTRIYAKVDLVGLRQVADFDLGGLL